MFRFADPNFLYLLILLPFLVALYLYSNYHRRQNIRKYGDPALLKGNGIQRNNNYKNDLYRTSRRTVLRPGLHR